MENQELIKALKETRLQHSNGWSDDIAIANAFTVAQVFHKHNAPEMLADREQLGEFIANNVSRGDNILMHVFGAYHLKNTVWLDSVLKTAQARPDIEFIARPLIFPTIQTAEQFEQIIGRIVLDKRPTTAKSEQKYYCLCEWRFTLPENLKFHDGKNFYRYSIDPTPEFRKMLDENVFGLLCENLWLFSSIELLERDDGNVLGTLNASIGHRYAFLMPKSEIMKMYERAAAELRAQETKQNA